MGLENWYINRKLKGAYRAMSNDNKNTIFGLILAGLGATQIDYGKAFHLDPTEAAKIAGAVVFAIFSYYTNKPDATKTPKP